LANICIKNEIVVKEGEVYQAIIGKLRVNYFAKIVILFRLSSGVHVRIKYGCCILSLKIAAVDEYAIWMILRRDKICEDATLTLLP
jgi:hypothetical protein